MSIGPQVLIFPSGKHQVVSGKSISEGVRVTTDSGENQSIQIHKMTISACDCHLAPILSSFIPLKPLT